MCEQLCSVGLDVGTTTTQLVFSRLTVENRASAFAVPDMRITNRQILYESPVHFTPLLGKDRVDAAALRELVSREYEQAGIAREDVDTGAIIITGETSRKENARAVLSQLSGFAGEFVVATAGPDLESVLAAKGAGAVEYSQSTGKSVLHMDIGGGTANLALIQEGKITATGCLNVGGRLVKLDEEGRVCYISPVLQGLCTLELGKKPAPKELEEIARLLTRGLEMAAGVREEDPLLSRLLTKEAAKPWKPPENIHMISFSGGVADCIEQHPPALVFGDIGPELGKAIGQSRLCAGNYMLGKQTIRATVIGAGCHSTQLSGSTVYHTQGDFPIKNLPVVRLDSRQQQDADAIARVLAAQDGPVVLAMEGYASPDYAKVQALAEAIVRGVGDRPVYICLEQDMAKALGHSLRLRMPSRQRCVCMDRLRLNEGDYLDIGAPVGPCLPVVIKTLVLSRSSI